MDKKYTWNGIYNNFYKIPIKNNGYFDKSMISDAVNSAQNNLSDLKNENIFSSDILEHLLLSLVISTQIINNKKVVIIDFGGGCGNGYIAIKKFLNLDFQIDYHIVETNNMVVSASEFWKNNSLIYFHSKLPKLDIFPNIVYSSSSIQYVRNYKNIISQLCKYNSKFLLLSKFSAVDSKTYASVQKTISGIELPYWFINKTELIEFIQSFGYKLIFKTKSTREYNQDNFEINFRMNRTTDFLFKK